MCMCVYIYIYTRIYIYIYIYTHYIYIHTYTHYIYIYGVCGGAPELRGQDVDGDVHVLAELVEGRGVPATSYHYY